MTKITPDSGTANIGSRPDEVGPETSAFTQALVRASQTVGATKSSGADSETSTTSATAGGARSVNGFYDNQLARMVSGPALVETVTNTVRSVEVQTDGLSKRLTAVGSVGQELATDGVGHTTNMLDRLGDASAEIKEALGRGDRATVEEEANAMASELSGLSNLLSQVSQAAEISRRSGSVAININLSGGHYGLQVSVSRLGDDIDPRLAIQDVDGLTQTLDKVNGMLDEISELMAEVLSSFKGSAAGDGAAGRDSQSLMDRTDQDLKAALQAGAKVGKGN